MNRICCRTHGRASFRAYTRFIQQFNARIEPARAPLNFEEWPMNRRRPFTLYVLRVIFSRAPLLRDPLARPSSLRAIEIRSYEAIISLRHTEPWIIAISLIAPLAISLVAFWSASIWNGRSGVSSSFRIISILTKNREGKEKLFLDFYPKISIVLSLDWSIVTRYKFLHKRIL